MRRYLQLTVITTAGVAIYPLLYPRQNFEVSLLETFNISVSQLGQCNAILGVLFFATYTPSGWLADRVAPRYLMAFSLLGTGLIGLWFSTVPSFAELRLIYVGWGVTAGLTFWSVHIKAVAVIALREEQDCFFGLLDGGRGLVEAILATMAVATFAYMLNGLGESTDTALWCVIWLYVGTLLVLSPVVFFVVDDSGAKTTGYTPVSAFGVLGDLKLTFSKMEVWLTVLCIMAVNQLFFATCAFSAYLQQNFGLTAVTVGMITVAKLWMRPIGAIGAGFFGDYLNREKVLAALLLGGAAALASLGVVPPQVSTGLLVAIVLIVGFITYAARGIYWATLEACRLPDRVKGLAIGFISTFAYAPDIYLPLIRVALIERLPGQAGYSIYFVSIAAFGMIGATGAWRLHRLVIGRQFRQSLCS